MQLILKTPDPIYDIDTVFGNYESAPGVYYQNFQHINGCDSLISFELQHHLEIPVQVMNPVFICPGDSAWPINNPQADRLGSIRLFPITSVLSPIA